MRTMLIFVLVFAACGAPLRPPDDTRCVRGTLEDDLQRVGALAGAEVDAGVLKPGNYLVSSTYLKLTTDPKGQAAFQDVMKGIIGVLPDQPGLAAFRLATSNECLTARTISVWKDEASMYRFISVEAHAKAVSSIGTISRGGGVVTHWADTEAGATFEQGAQRLADAVGPFF